MPLTSTDITAAGVQLRRAATELDDALGRLRLAALLDWRSPAADRCRSEVAALTGLLDADGATVSQALLVTAGCES